MKYLILIGAVLLIRLPFINQAVTGDDVYYLASAEHAQIDPLHPNHTLYTFQGKDVDFRGYPHPPLTAWALAALLAIFGDVYEVPFHAAYIFFSLIAVSAMWALAKRFSPHPLWAALLFIAAPVFVINGNTFESDVPLTAFWLAGVAAFVTAVDRRSLPWLGAAFAFLGAGSLCAVQAVFAVPILAAYVWLKRRDWKPAWVVTLSPAIVLSAWQAFEYFSIGHFPIFLTTSYVVTYGLARWQSKLVNLGGLSVHALFLVFPLLLIPVFRARGRDAQFLFAWIALFFCGACALFSDGSARYLLPIAAPVALLASRVEIKYLWPAFVAQLILALLLAAVNYRHWSGYRDFARSLAQQTRTHRTWANAEWGLRWYFEANGALPVHQHQQIPSGDLLVSSELAYPTPINRGGSALAPIAKRDITSAIPLRLIGIDSHSGYSTAGKGFFPFGISTGPIDRVRADILVERKPTLEYLPMNAPEADDQIVSGVYGLDGNTWRWTSGSAVIALKAPAQPEPIHVDFNIPEASPVRTVKLIAGAREIFSRSYSKPGSYTFDTAPVQAGMVTLQLDRSFSVPNDGRELGLILVGIGYRR